MHAKHVTFIATVLLAAVTPAHAEDLRTTVMRMARRVGVHGNVGLRHPGDADVRKGVSIGPSVGLSPGGTNGWKYPVALTMFGEDLHGPAGDRFGAVRSRIVLAGVGYGWHFGRLSVGPQFEIGYAFTHGTLEERAPVAFGVPGSISMQVDNAWALRPEFKAEYFVTPKFTIRSSVDYLRLRPDISVTTPDGVIADRWDLSNVHVNVGIGFYPFRR
jgi:hypothetical protein